MIVTHEINLVLIWQKTWICFERDNNVIYFGFNFDNIQFYNLYQIWFQQNLKSLI